MSENRNSRRSISLVFCLHLDYKKMVLFNSLRWPRRRDPATEDYIRIKIKLKDFVKEWENDIKQGRKLYAKKRRILTGVQAKFDCYKGYQAIVKREGFNKKFDLLIVTVGRGSEPVIVKPLAERKYIRRPTNEKEPTISGGKITYQLKGETRRGRARLVAGNCPKMNELTYLRCKLKL
jgi:hypothetical protein